MIEFDLERLPAFLATQRWFQRKPWPIKAVRTVDLVKFPASRGEAILAVAEVIFVGVPAEYYLLSLVEDDKGRLQPALDDDRVVRALVSLVREQGSISIGGTVLRGERLPRAPTSLDDLPAAPEVRHISAEQSNTSVVIGEGAIMKVIRRLEPGLNPEYEIGRFLGERTSFRRAPALLGALHIEGQILTTIATVHHFVPNARTGWDVVLEGFRAAGPLDPGLVKMLQQLGGRVGELHLALASDPSDPAFAPEPIQLEDLQRWAASIAGEVGVALAQAQTRARYPDAFDKRGQIVARAQRLTRITPSGKKIRTHGDLHLGQVLWCEQGWLIFDFEGEPARSYEHRREKHSPLRDVAGVLRSFSYAGARAEMDGAPRTDHVEKARAAFLDGYLTATQGSGLLPEADVDLLGLLHALELEKVLYEVRYEVNNRPDWAEIPISALLNPGEVGGA